ncbi:sigma-70 family RNA polymerase sigma factor [Flavobacterium daemonense]|uniref:sigma-70 family RNA polymerase sigma factor n=1 Tax=Flavobacterium daemonense TaxID=1393049 RepID=UPI001185FCA3|nr:sigma-70 family RNA polymerase sigma factor [Flavobacterium daemonense]KAF2337241.1 sigma-70 family RNA polymerase sigma factor [Flavobacterium daemonense]
MKQFHRELQNINKDLQYIELLQLFEDYKTNKSPAIRDKIFNANLGLVFSICNRYKTPDTDDLEQYGFIGLLSAIDGFDPTKKIKFSTYATTCITNEINTGLNLVKNTIPIPKHYIKQVKDGTLQEITTTDLERVELEIQEAENGIDKQLFWFMVNKICTPDEIDLLLKRYCSEQELSLNHIAKSIDQTKQNTHNKLQRAISKLKKNEFFKNKIQNNL